MTEQVQSRRNHWSTSWIAIRFVIFGVGGFVALLTGSIALLDLLEPISPHDLSSLAGLPVAVIGGLMMLFGSGTWGRWDYLWVFFSLPIVLCSAALLERYAPNWERYVPFDGKLFGMVLFAAPMVLSYGVVKKYYKRREATLPSSMPATQTAKDEEVS